MRGSSPRRDRTVAGSHARPTTGDAEGGSRPITDEHTTSSTVDALGRAKTRTLPADQRGHQRVVSMQYNEAGAVRSVQVAANSAPEAAVTSVVAHMTYNALGQPALALYGNGVMERVALDAATGRVVRRRAERVSFKTDDRPAGVARATPAYDGSSTPPGLESRVIVSSWR